MLTPKDLWSTLSDELQERRSKGLFRSLTSSDSTGPTTAIRQEKELLHFASNDYLALAWNPLVRREFQRIAGENGVGSGASPLILGASPQYIRLVETLASWHQCESAIVFPTGYAANLGVIRSLATPDDLILSDSLNHACLIDGCRLSKATVKVYPHGDMDSLKSLLATHRSHFRMAFIVTDTIFSMDGDLAPVTQIESLCRQYDAIGIADEAHATGVLGQQGRGVLELANADPKLWIKTGTLSKAVGCIGGYVVGSHVLCQTLLHRSRSLIYSTALPPAALGAACMAIGILQRMDAQRDQLSQLACFLRKEITALGLRTTNDSTPIIPIYVRDPHEAIWLSNKLFQAGIYVPAIRPPTVPPEGCLIRISLNAAHTLDDCRLLIRSLV